MITIQIEEKQIPQDGDDFRQLETELTQAGYQAHYNPIDAEVVSEFPCDECGHTCSYKGYKKDNSYRAFSVCDLPEGCGHFEEF